MSLQVTLGNAMASALASIAGDSVEPKKSTKPVDTEQTRQVKFQMAHRNHVPGHTFKMLDGTEYASMQSGAWQRTTVRWCSSSTNLKNNGVRRRLKNEKARV